MKKFLAIVSLVLVFAMFAAIPSFAEGYEYVWEDPKDVPKIYASDISDKAAPVIDGVINPDEYGKVITLTDQYFTMGDKYPEIDYTIKEERIDQPASEKFEYYFAYDNENIYIAFKDYGGVWEEGSATAQFLDSLEAIDKGYRNFALRSNYYIFLGFLLDDMTNGIALGCSSRGWDESRVYDMGTASSYVPVGDLVEELYMRKYNATTNEVFAKCDVTGSLIPDVKGNANQYEGQFIAECEIKLSKSHIIDVLNEWHYTEITELSNACWFYITNRSYVGKDITMEEIAAGEKDNYDEPVTSHNKYFMSDVRGKKADYVDYGMLEGDNRQLIGSLLVFAPEGTPIKMYVEDYSDETEAPAGDVTEAPAGDETEAPAGDVTEAPVTEEPAAKGGCGSSVSLAGLALVAALGTCTVFVAKKKED